MSAANQVKVGAKRHFFRFRLGSLLVLVAIAAILLGYLSNRASKIRHAVSSFRESGGKIGFDYQYDGLREDKMAELWVPKWLRESIGDEYFVDIVNISFQGNANTSNRNLAPIASLTSVRRIDLDYTPIDDISALRGQTKLRWLDLEETNVDSEDLIELRNLRNLEHLILTRTAITDEGLEYVADMTKLIYLGLNETKVSDRCLVHFERLVNLRELELSDTNVTESGIQSLQRELPNCEIKWGSKSRND